MSALTASYRWLDDDGPAFGAPGLAPRWTSSKKDAVSTAYAASSRVWFTASHGILNEIYYPTIDRPQTRDMELLFTDGITFCHEEKRDLNYDFQYIDGDALAIRVVAHDADGRYSVTKEFITNPHHPVVIVNVKITGDKVLLSRLKCYALLAPHLNGGGAGNSARSVDVAGRRCILAWKGNTSLAMGADCGFASSSCGYVGTSDGFLNLCRAMRNEAGGSAKRSTATSQSWERLTYQRIPSSRSPSDSETDITPLSPQWPKRSLRHMPNTSEGDS